MSLQVTSWFLEQSARQTSTPARHFYIGGSEYSHLVMRWPTLRFKEDTIDLGTTQMELANPQNTLGFLAQNEGSLSSICEVSLGFTHPQSGEERLSLFTGAPSHLAFKDHGAGLRLQLQGKTRKLTDRFLGDDTNSGGVGFTSSAYYPSELAWILMTSYGGLSPVASDSNPDMDYTGWLAWQDDNRVRDIRIKAYLTGEKIYQAINHLAYMDSRVITFQNGKLRFKPVFSPYNQTVPALKETLVMDMAVSIDPAQIVNHFVVSTTYDPATGRFNSISSDVNSASEELYGRHSARFASRTVWFDTPNDGRYLVADQTRAFGLPSPEVSLKTPLAGGLPYSVGDVISLTHSGFGFLNTPFRIMEMDVDLENGSLGFQLGAAVRRPWQYLATVADRNINTSTIQPVGSETFLGIDESINGYRVFRTDSAGVFAPTPVYATALLPLNGNEVVYGGPPASGSLASVLQRSSDSGSSSVVVCSLGASYGAVYGLYQVSTATLLASTGSGGIFRSVDGGSSWVHTFTISGDYHAYRFFSPCSGTLWAGTGYDGISAKGVHIWRSLDAGATWAPAYTVVSSGLRKAQGFYALPGGEFLVGLDSTTFSDLGIFRSGTDSSGAIQWTAVGCYCSFTKVSRTSSGHLLFGFHQNNTGNGGMVYRSLDAGSSWMEDSRISKKGNIALSENPDGTLDAFVCRGSIGFRTDRFRNFQPNKIH